MVLISVTPLRTALNLMGRRRLNVELISSEKSRYSTYIKRKTCLKKKIDQLSTLCGIKVGMIVYGPRHDCHTTELDIWPNDGRMISELINSYKSQSSDACRIRTYDVYHYFQDLKKKAEDITVKLRKQNNEAKYPTWDHTYNNLSKEQLWDFYAALSEKLDALNKNYKLTKDRLEQVKSPVMNSSSIGQASKNYSYSIGSFSRGYNYNPPPEFAGDLPVSMRMSSDVSLPINYMFEQDYQEFAPSSVPNSMRMTMNCNSYNGQFGHSSNYRASMPMYYDPLFGLSENMCLNYPMPMLRYYDPSIPPMLQEVSYMTFQGSSSLMHASNMKEMSNGESDCKIERQG